MISFTISRTQGEQQVAEARQQAGKHHNLCELIRNRIESLAEVTHHSESPRNKAVRNIRCARNQQHPCRCGIILPNKIQPRKCRNKQKPECGKHIRHGQNLVFVNFVFAGIIRFVVFHVLLPPVHPFRFFHRAYAARAFLCISFFALIICRLPQRCINSTSTSVKKSRYHLFKEIIPFSVFLDGEGFILYFYF